MKTTIQSSELECGMFVTDLDRPWLETPFLLQGFLIDDDAQLAQLREYCQTVVIDRSRSIGPHFACDPAEKDAPLQASPLVYQRADDARPEDFPAICRQLRQKAKQRRFRQPPAVCQEDGHSRLEAELVYSAPIVDDVQEALKSVHDRLASGSKAELPQLGPLVQEMAQGVKRNPEALLWLARLKSTDQYSYDHAVDVSVHLMVFGRFLGLAPEIVEQLGLAGLMQDIGKTDIPPDILNKRGRLTQDEMAKVQTHVGASLEMLLGTPGFTMDLLSVIASHHERLDGSGYPRRLKGQKINFYAELAGLIDSYCAMTRVRPYDDARSSQNALEDLVKARGIKFRDALVDQFIQCIGLYPIGSLVELNTGEVGAVIQQNQVRRLKPRVLIILGPDKSFERRPRTLDLMMEPQTPTGEPYRVLRALPPDAYGINPTELYLG